MAQSFFKTLEQRVAAADSLLCVGLDPHAQDLQRWRDAHGKAEATDCEAAEGLCLELIEQTKEAAAAFKPNAAFFEALGSEGIEVLKRVVAAVPEGTPVVLDAKRGDISSTAEAYAEAIFGQMQAHCTTLHPYMGFDSVKPFVEGRPERGAFVLCKTSNPSSEDLETAELKDGVLLYERVAALCSAWNKDDNVGLVVGATDVEALRRSRAAAPSLWILAPGVGFQGGNLEEAAAAGLREDGMGLLVPVSRGISRAEDPKAAAEGFREQLNAVRAAAATARKNDAGEGSRAALADYQRAFFALALRCGVLKFGDFTLKSGRQSPYFFNAGLFSSGSALDGLGRFYARCIVESKLEYDVIFGPAYKGIPLGAVIAVSLSRDFGLDIPFAYNRKEAKDHGEGGVLVGASVRDKRVLVVDDVITAGTAIRQSISLLATENATVAGVVIALDRQERTGEEPVSAIQSVKREFGIDVFSIVGLDDLLSYVKAEGASFDADQRERIETYRATFGVDR